MELIESENASTSPEDDEDYGRSPKRNQKKKSPAKSTKKSSGKQTKTPTSSRQLRSPRSTDRKLIQVYAL